MAEADSKCRFLCGSCRLPITKPLAALDQSAVLVLKDGEPLVPSGWFDYSAKLLDWTSIGDDGFLINLSDLIDVVEGGVRNGCCGPDGGDGINMFCRNGHPIGTEYRDCWTPAFIYIQIENVNWENC